MTQRLLLVASVLVTLCIAVPAVADDGGLPCDPFLNDCVAVGVEDPGNGGSPGTAGGTGSGPADPDPCDGHDAYGRILCEAGLRPGNWRTGWGPADTCYAIYTREKDTLTLEDLNATLAAANCPAAPAKYVAPSPATLAQQAAAGFVLPTPVIGRFPGGAGWTLRDGTPYTLVRIPTWFWVNPSSWITQTATARAGGNWATVTATPTTLTFAPGDGGRAVSCAGPGTAFDPQRDTVVGSWVPKPQPQGCDYRYPQTSAKLSGGVATATLTITWRLTWTGSGNTAGTLTERSTSSTATFAVAEAQAVVVR